MQAYVFWHRPRPGVDWANYEVSLRRFHERLAASATLGLTSSSSARLSQPPFTWPATGPDDSPTYEDWYLVEDGAALDALEVAAVSAARALHDAAAALAGAGSAGLYRLVAGTHDHRARTATWCDLPAGHSRQHWESSLAERSAEPDFPVRALWARRLTLGPAPEFCLLGPGGAGLEGSVEIERHIVT